MVKVPQTEKKEKQRAERSGEKQKELPACLLIFIN